MAKSKSSGQDHFTHYFPKRELSIGDYILMIMPHSEVCMHLRVAGRIMGVRLVGMHNKIRGRLHCMAQLVNPLDGKEYSFPITTGEAGVYTDSDGKYYGYEAPTLGPKEQDHVS